jgi:transcription termination factor NusB
MEIYGNIAFMNENNAWIDSQNERFDRIKSLLDEILDNHMKMQELLSDALTKVQTERVVIDIEKYLRNKNK